MNDRKKDRIIVIGAGIVDVLVNPVDVSVFEKGSVPVEHIKISTGGDALNEAVILARLQRNLSKVSLVTVLGNDDAGRSVLNRCEQEGIDTSFVVIDEKQETAVNVVMIQPDGSRSFFTNPKSSLRKLSLEHIPEKFPEDAGILCLASIFVSPLLGNEELAEIFQRAKSQNMLICADMTKCKNQEKVFDMKEAFSYIDYLFANEEEAAMVTGKTSREEMANEFLKYGVKNVMIKCGGEGCYVKSQMGELENESTCSETSQIESICSGVKKQEQQLQVAQGVQELFPAVPDVSCVDTTGAGDTFAAGFICALSEGKSLEECVKWGNACGSLTVEKVGACEGIQNRKQVLERLKCLE